MADIVTRVHKGTRSDGDDLCVTCSKSTIIKSGRDSDERRFCGEVGQNGMELKGRVAECNSYYNKNLPGIRELYETAIIITTDKTGKIGFMPYGKFKNSDKKNDFDKEWIDY